MLLAKLNSLLSPCIKLFIVITMEPWPHVDYTCGPSQALFSLSLKTRRACTSFITQRSPHSYNLDTAFPKTLLIIKSGMSAEIFVRLSLRIRAVSMVSLLRLMFELVVFNFLYILVMISIFLVLYFLYCLAWFTTCGVTALLHLLAQFVLFFHLIMCNIVL